ncbi:hypothetical protein [Streptomyces phaeochromogenes]|uniref:hypothetical protein n=1 Tax=Streptomyces phaeochromogenes TaxID=1923 RepID=UPI0006E2DD60|nr:hypothetical protein [Streptomyces phaeochromogenes]
MPDLPRYARQLRELADVLDAQSDQTDESLTPHPDTMKVIAGRHTTRGQINYAVPDALQLQRRIRRYHADHAVQHGDIVAIALDSFLRAKGYPPDLVPSKAEKR